LFKNISFIRLFQCKIRIISSKYVIYYKVVIIERDINRGLAESIIEGVTMLCDKKGKVIVLEDDLLTSKYFLEYMNTALEKYEMNEKVMHVSGYMYPISAGMQCGESFFLPLTSSWGWGTWGRSWNAFERDGLKLYKELKDNNLFYGFDVQGSYNYKRMLKNQINGKIDSWAIRWYASVFLRKGLVLFPAYSLVENIGLDDSGVHCSATKDYDVKLSDEYKVEMPSSVKVSKKMIDKLAQYYKKNHKPFHQKVIQRIQKMISK